MTETPSPRASRRPDAALTGEVDAHHLSQLALSVHQGHNVADTAERVLDYALFAVDCSHAAVVFVRARQRLEVVASTNPDIARLIAKVMEVRAGPALAIVRDHDDVVVADTHDEPRWPAWASTAAELGFRSMMGVRLHASEHTLGTLNLYDSRPHQFSTADLQVAHVLARHTAIALSRVRTCDDLSRAVDSRHLIGQAQGMLMERYNLDPDRSFEVLQRYSQDNNIKLRDVAQLVVQTRGLPARSSRRVDDTPTDTSLP